MAFNLADFVRLRPFVHHLTAASNLPLLLAAGELRSAEILMRAAGQEALVHQRRGTGVHVLIGEARPHIRDQSPLHPGNVELEAGWTFEDVVALLNRHAFYYSDALRSIVRFHDANHDTAWLLERAAELHDKATTEQRRPFAIQFASNGRALESYAQHFATPWCSRGAMPKSRLSLRFGRVVVAASPDVVLRVKNADRFVKLAFSKEAQDERVSRVMAQVMFEALEEHGLGVTSGQVRVYNLSSGDDSRGARLGSRLRADIEAACETLEALWDRM
jgi:hypothetical protein